MRLRSEPAPWTSQRFSPPMVASPARETFWRALICAWAAVDDGAVAADAGPADDDGLAPQVLAVEVERGPGIDRRADGRAAQGGRVGGHEDARGDDRPAGIAAGPVEDQRAGAVFRQCIAGTAHGAADGQRAAADGHRAAGTQRHRAAAEIQVLAAQEGEVGVPVLRIVVQGGAGGRAVDRAAADGEGPAAQGRIAVDHQHAAREDRAAGIGAAAREDQRAAAGFDQPAAAQGVVGQDAAVGHRRAGGHVERAAAGAGGGSQGDAAVGVQREVRGGRQRTAVEHDVPCRGGARRRAQGAIGRNHHRAAVDRRHARVTVRVRDHERARVILDQPRRPGDAERAVEGISGRGIAERDAGRADVGGVDVDGRVRSRRIVEEHGVAFQVIGWRALGNELPVVGRHGAPTGGAGAGPLGRIARDAQIDGGTGKDQRSALRVPRPGMVGTEKAAEPAVALSVE